MHAGVSVPFDLVFLFNSFPGPASGKEPTCQCTRWKGCPVQSLGQEDPLQEEMANPLQYSCLENPHGQRSLVGYSPWDCKELDMTEQLSPE